MEREDIRFTYETPELTAFSWTTIRGTVIGDGDVEITGESGCTDQISDPDGTGTGGFDLFDETTP